MQQQGALNVVKQGMYEQAWWTTRNIKGTKEGKKGLSVSVFFFFLSCLKIIETKKGLNVFKVKSVLSEVPQKSSDMKNHQCTCSISHLLSFADLPQLHCLIFPTYLWLALFLSISFISEKKKKQTRSKTVQGLYLFLVNQIPFIDPVCLDMI